MDAEDCKGCNEHTAPPDALDALVVQDGPQGGPQGGVMDPHKFHKLQMEILRTFARCEYEHASRVVIHQQNGIVYFPEPWVEAIKETPELEHNASQFIPLPLAHLAPMTAELRDLAKKCGLPKYRGKAKPNPPARAGDAKSRGKRTRCPRCGEWMTGSDKVSCPNGCSP